MLDDTRLPVSLKYKEGQSPYDMTYNQYRIGLNLHTRFDVATPVASSVVDANAPYGVKQALVTFGNFLVLFCAGNAYYKLYDQLTWTQITGFSMSTTAPRYWTVAVPLTTTNYGRIANPVSAAIPNADAGGGINQVQLNVVAGAFGNNPGLLVQDGINQPTFLYVNQNGIPTASVTQTYAQWSITYDANYNVIGPDNREYVPIGTFMEWFNGILFIVDPAFTYIYRSVSGRPLDFVVNVDINGAKGGDATTTSYSVGVAGITAMRSMPGNMLFVSAGNSVCFSVTLNTTPNAPTIFGEYTFIRTVLFNASCVTERGVIDVLGDSVFIDSNGLRSFNAVEQQQNEGRNSVFSATVQSLFTDTQQNATINASTGSSWCAAVNFDNYAIFSVNTTSGPALVVYDTLNSVYASLDTLQLSGSLAKQFAAFAVQELALFAITDDDRVVQLYGAESNDTATIRLGAVCEQNPAKEMKVNNVRAVFTNITENTTVTVSLFVNNRLAKSLSTTIAYVNPVYNWTGPNIGNDVGTQTNNLFFDFSDAQAQGWKSFIVLSWTGAASLTSTAVNTQDLTPSNPPMTQSVQLQS